MLLHKEYQGLKSKNNSKNNIQKFLILTQKVQVSSEKF